MRWLLRMKRWAENPPPPRTVALVLGVVAVCIGLWVIEQVFGWPDWLTPNRFGFRGPR